MAGMVRVLWKSMSYISPALAWYSRNISLRATETRVVRSIAYEVSPGS
jgi:hypothetical protein